MKVAHVQMIYHDLPIQKCALFMAISAFKRVSVSDQVFHKAVPVGHISWFITPSYPIYLHLTYYELL